MHWSEFFIGLCLLLVFEGLIPAIAPKRYQEMIQRLLSLTPQQLRRGGLASMIVGVLLLMLLKHTVYAA